tara:strand:+ start:71222 stop:71923 length:702 start_codon:yes stop_codon:yes gene_type:complete
MSSLDNYVIHKAKPYRLAIIILIVVIITTISVWFFLKEDSTTLQQNLMFLEKNLNLSRQNTQQLSDERLDLREQNKQLNDTTSIQLQELNIQQATVDQLQQQIVDLQDQVITLNKELMFYQNITQGVKSTELQIKELYLTADAEQSDIIYYRLVITQGKNITKPVTGLVNINIDTDATVLAEHPLKLRYVQLIEGRLKIADNDQPKSITVTITQNKKPKLTRTFDWQLASTIK